ncbi:MAG: DUF3971 domain-containing protein [Acetobacteraceae bacterium]|jgi:hypothetical protein|nr:DUF3971 domain-containing protein [Acetobacteraceae bacterium]
MIRLSGRLLRALLALTLMLAVAGTTAIGALAWRLAQGPLALDQLARILEAHFNSEGGARITIGSAALAWEGFGLGIDRPFDIRVTDLRLFDRAGAEVVALPKGEVSLGLRNLLLGRIEPRAISLTGLRLTLVRDAEGAIRFDLGRSGEAEAAPASSTLGRDPSLFAELGLAPLAEGEEPTRWSHLRRLLMREGELVVEDRQLGAYWTIPDAEVLLRRVPAARGTAIAAEASGIARAGEARLPLTLRAHLAPDGIAEAELTVAPVEPAALAAALPALAPLAAVEARLSGTLSLTRAADGAISTGRLNATLGPGRIVLPGTTPVPVTVADISARFGAGGITVDEARLSMPGTAGPAPTVTASGHATPDEAGAWIAEARLMVDAVAATDLSRLWPESVAPNPRKWITENITAGLARDLAVTLRATLPASRDRITVDHVEGGLRAEAVTVHYLRPMPPVEGIAADLRLGLTEIGIAARGGKLGAIVVPEGTVRISGLDQPVERVDIRLRVEAPLAEAIRLLEHPRIDLLSRRPLPPGITGSGEATVTLGFPLLSDLGFDQIAVNATARTADGRVPDLLAGHAFERARVDLTVNEQGLRLSGSGSFGQIRADVQGEMDFRQGPASQVVERFSARVPAQEGIPAMFDLDLAPYLTGPIAAEAVLETRRNGQGTATVRADLREARLAVAELGAEKPAGTPARGEGRLTLSAGRLTGAEITRLEAGDIGGRARFTLTRAGRLDRIEVTEARIGTSRLAGSVQLPQAQGGAYGVTLRGPVLDLSKRSAAPPGQRGAEEQAARGPHISLEAAFDRVVFRPGHELADVRGRGAVHSGGVIARADVTARAGERGTLRAQIVPEGQKRALTLTADDAGAALNALGIITTMAGGTLSVRGQYDDTQAGRPLTGEAEILSFRMREAPAGARVLQAMTLYGALELARGPGLAFDRAVAAFTLTDGALELRDARAFGASLGFTAKGRIDRRNDTIDLEGTIVPAYVFNSLLGHIPLIGRLFSPEQGGGVFAATYRVRGPLADPEASVNPLAALTPGFLRGLFGIFEGGGQQGQPPPAEVPDHQRGG